jgi:two-component system response regulator NreC
MPTSPAPPQAEWSVDSSLGHGQARRPRITSGVLTDDRSFASDGRGVSASLAPIDIVLAHPQALVRSGLRMLLDSVGEFKVVAEAEDFEGARRYVSGHHPRVLVLDLDLETPGCSASAAIRLVRTASPETGVVALSVNQDLAVVREAIAAGALGYLPTSATAQDLIEAVRRAGFGRAYLSPVMLTAIARPSQPGPAELSSREVEIIGLIAIGFTNLEMAERLILSVRTIEAHRARMQMKLGHLTRAELVAYAGEHRMIRGG